MQTVRPNPFWLTVAALPTAAVRLAVRVLIALVALFCVLLLVIRFVVFPQLESCRRLGRVEPAPGHRQSARRRWQERHAASAVAGRSPHRRLDVLAVCRPAL